MERGGGVRVHVNFNIEGRGWEIVEGQPPISSHHSYEDMIFMYPHRKGSEFMMFAKWWCSSTSNYNLAITPHNITFHDTLSNSLLDR